MPQIAQILGYAFSIPHRHKKLSPAIQQKTELKFGHLAVQWEHQLRSKSTTRARRDKLSVLKDSAVLDGPSWAHLPEGCSEGRCDCGLKLDVSGEVGQPLPLVSRWGPQGLQKDPI